MNEYEKIKNTNRLSTTIQNLLHLMNEFVKKLKNLKNKVTVHFADDQLQKQKQTLVEYSNFIFIPVENSQIISDKTLTKKH